MDEMLVASWDSGKVGKKEERLVALMGNLAVEK
jgi:hypothetical protein